MRVEILNNYSDFLRMNELWTRTLEASSFNHIFLTHEWISSWWEDFGEGNKLFVILIWDSDTLVAAAPLMIRNIRVGKLVVAKKLQFIAHEVSDYMDFIIIDQREKYFRIIIDVIKAHSRQWDWAEFIYISELSPNYRYWQSNNSNPKTMIKIIRQKDVSIGLTFLDESGRRRDPSAILPSKNRLNSDLLKQYSKLLNHEKQVEVVQTNNYSDFENAFEPFVECHKINMKNRGKASPFNSETEKQRLLRLSKKLSQKGWLEFVALKTQDKYIAMIIGFKYNKTFYYYMPTYNYEYRKYSPGNLIVKLLLQSFLENKAINDFDFLRGNEKYKYDWANHKIALFSVQLFTSRIKFFLFFLLGKKAESFFNKYIKVYIGRAMQRS